MTDPDKMTEAELREALKEALAALARSADAGLKMQAMRDEWRAKASALRSENRRLTVHLGAARAINIYTRRDRYLAGLRKAAEIARELKTSTICSADGVVLGTYPTRHGKLIAEAILAEISREEARAKLPDWEDLRGRAPDATGDLSSEDFVRQMRDEWPDAGREEKVDPP